MRSADKEDAAPQNCQWCGHTASAFNTAMGGWAVGCDDSSGCIVGPTERTDQEAINSWNRIRIEPEKDDK